MSSASTTRANKKTKSAAAVTAVPTTAAELREAIAKQEASLAGTARWRDESKFDELASALADRRRELEIAELKELPAPAAVQTAFVERAIPIAAILITGNHREQQDAAALESLSRSLQTQMLQQRIGVRAIDGGRTKSSEGQRFELIFGSRRLGAAKLAGWTEIPAKVYDSGLTPAQVEILRSIENFGRKNLTPVEEAMAVARVIDAIEQTLGRALTGSDDPLPMDVGQRLEADIANAGGLDAYVGQQFSRPAKWVKDHAYVSKLGGEARTLLMAGRIDIGHARELAKLGDKVRIDHIAGYAARDEQLLGGRDVAWVKRQVHDELKSLRVVPWVLDIAFGQGVAGCTGHACMTCPFNSKTDPDLFGGSITDEPAAGTCTNGSCYAAKGKIVDDELTKAAKKATPVVKKIVDRQVRDGLSGDAAPNPITQVTVGGLLPRIVKPASGLRRLQKDLAALVPKEPAAGATPAAGGTTANGKPTKRTPEEVAKDKLYSAQAKWREAVREVFFVEVANDKDGRRAIAALLLDQTDFANDLAHARWSQDKGEAARLIDENTDLIDAAIDYAGPLLKKLAIELSERISDAMTSLEDDECVPVLARIAAAWGGTVPPAPVLEDFLPKPKAVTAKPPAVADANVDETAGDFAEDQPALTPRDIGVDELDLARHDASENIAECTKKHATIQSVISTAHAGRRYVVLGTVQHRGHECWRLASLLPGSKSDLEFSDANAAAAAGQWDGIGVIDAADGKTRKRISAIVDKFGCGGVLYVRTSNTPAAAGAGAV